MSMFLLYTSQTLSRCNEASLRHVRCAWNKGGVPLSACRPARPGELHPACEPARQFRNAAAAFRWFNSLSASIIVLFPLLSASCTTTTKLFFPSPRSRASDLPPQLPARGPISRPLPRCCWLLTSAVDRLRRWKPRSPARKGKGESQQGASSRNPRGRSSTWSSQQEQQQPLPSCLPIAIA